MNDEEWAGWLKDRWFVSPFYPDNGGPRWVIIAASDIGAASATSLGPEFQDEETARHIVRCHNQWLANLQPIGEELNADAAPPEGRAPES